jgi:hypothetical protein
VGSPEGKSGGRSPQIREWGATMIWADRWAVGFFVIGFLFFSYMLENLQGGAKLSAIVAVIAWVVFRTFDFMFRGSARRPI